MAPAAPYVLFDTGPLLCFAACKRGPRRLKERYAGRAGIVLDIAVELSGLRRSAVPEVAKVASRAIDSFDWLDRITVDDPVVLARVEELRVRLRAFTQRPDQDQATSRKDWGECVTLAHAESISAGSVVLVVANEDAARALAQRLAIPTASAVDVLRGMVRDGKITKKEAHSMYREMVAVTDAGDVMRGPDDFVGPGEGPSR